MIQYVTLRCLYALHMLAPLAFVAWHTERLSPDTLGALLALFK
jgi:hypothetical protein